MMATSVNAARIVQIFITHNAADKGVTLASVIRTHARHVRAVAANTPTVYDGVMTNYYSHLGVRRCCLKPSTPSTET